MSEQELKLHVPMASRAALERELRQAGAERLPLRAMYFDTPSRELARARIAIRLRREGSNWVQTLKTPGANSITRVEMNHRRPGPILDLSVYAGTEVQDALMAIKGELGLRYETDVLRLVRKVRGRLGTVEIAYDYGMLRAGELELPISEIEFELVSGRLPAIFAVARSWQPRHGLVLDPRSKSERGDLLARLGQTLAEPGQDEAARAAAVRGFWEPRAAHALGLNPEMTPAEALASVAAECLDQIARNAAVLAEVDTLGRYGAGQPEHVHQLRVGMRRLRSAWRLFREWAELPGQGLQDGLRAHFAAFGANRDQDVLEESIIPALVKAGMPTFPMNGSSRPPVSAQETAGSPQFQGWLLDLLEWSLDVQPAVGAGSFPAAEPDVGSGSAGAADLDAVHAAHRSPHAADEADAGHAVAQGHGDASAADTDSQVGATVRPVIIPLHPQAEPRALRALLARRLRKWHKQVLHQGARFGELDIPARHALRKRAKRLRYGLSFAEPLLSPRKVRDYRKRLAQVQDALGEINDLAVAHDLYRQWSSRYPQAWFALGWISARQEKLVAEAQRAFARLDDAKRFWK